MNEAWKDIIITKIKVAVYVGPNAGKHIHKDRPFHGLVLNDSNGVKDYVFDDGLVLRTEPRALFYLPKGSSYHVVQHKIGGCYAINFDAELSDEPFAIIPENREDIKNAFKRACYEWRVRGITQNTATMGALYDIIGAMLREEEARHLPNAKYRLIEPAVEEINQRFLDPNLSVSHLAMLSGISEVYLRKIFSSHFRVSPKEYITRKRIDYARRLISSGQFEIQEVSRMCGYSDPGHFSREFKRHVGVSPREYQ